MEQCLDTLTCNLSRFPLVSLWNTIIHSWVALAYFGLSPSKTRVGKFLKSRDFKTQTRGLREPVYWSKMIMLDFH